MIANISSTPAKATPAWHAGFLDILPTIETYARFQFRHLSADHRDEAVQEAIAAATQSFKKLTAQGKEPAKFSSLLARFAVLHVKSGRNVGGSQSHRDVLSPTAQRCRRIHVVRLDEVARHDKWQTLVPHDVRGATPADTAAFRIDFAQWLQSLPPREARLALRLAVGDRCGELAKRLDVSPARISQLRRRLRNHWRRYQGETAVAS